MSLGPRYIILGLIGPIRPADPAPGPVSLGPAPVPGAVLRRHDDPDEAGLFAPPPDSSYDWIRY